MREVVEEVVLSYANDAVDSLGSSEHSIKVVISNYNGDEMSKSTGLSLLTTKNSIAYTTQNSETCLPKACGSIPAL